MIDMPGFEFLTPAWLLLLPLLWWLVWKFAHNHRQRSRWLRLCDAHLLKQMQRGSSVKPEPRARVWPLLVVSTLGVVAAAGPSWQQSQAIMESTNARVIALELSRTMLVTDVRPDRFTRSMAITREILNRDYGGETGLIVFAGAAFVVSPLSRDADTLLDFLEALEPSVMPADGNRIDLAINKAMQLLDTAVFGHGQIIVITTGSGLAGDAVEAAQRVAEQERHLSILAVGTAAGGPEIGNDGGLRRSDEGHISISKTNFFQLEQIARAADGVLLKLDDTSNHQDASLDQIKAQTLIEVNQINDIGGPRTVNVGVWLLWLILPCAWLLFRPNLLWVALLMVILPAEREVYASELDSIWRHPEHLAFEAYHAGNLRLTLKLSNDPLLRGAAFFRNGQYDEAIEHFKQDDSARAYYNRGNAHARLKQFDAALAAFDEAIKREPKHRSAHLNKRLIERFLAQQNDAEGGASENADNESSATETGALEASQERLGVIGQGAANPADQQQSGPGLGASLQNGTADPSEQFDGREQPLRRFSLSEDLDDARTQAMVERWIEKLPKTSTDLYRRKFLRDYQRQQQPSK